MIRLFEFASKSNFRWLVKAVKRVQSEDGRWHESMGWKIVKLVRKFFHQFEPQHSSFHVQIYLRDPRNNEIKLNKSNGRALTQEMSTNSITLSVEEAKRLTFGLLKALERQEGITIDDLMEYDVL